MGLFLEPFPYVWPRMDRLTYSPIVKGILESEGKIAGCPRTPAMAPTFHTKTQQKKHVSQFFVPSEIIENEIQIRKEFRFEIL